MCACSNKIIQIFNIQDKTNTFKISLNLHPIRWNPILKLSSLLFNEKSIVFTSGRHDAYVRSAANPLSEIQQTSNPQLSIQEISMRSLDHYRTIRVGSQVFAISVFGEVFPVFP
ncbi:hypothetical protein RF11_08047 [Thelohanellus kitauei]|uniref:Uncharacterized protein n=1 Tax=Thelohanellus kitauei TaxID=669202 RepID=A0A0C2J375_THEKT|nr:hypothetical protein RF11_08047 [Thelohanellus kitauei]